ncbi:hypothetical protein TIFTF001_040827 [Ficus carica]|uniref:Uncharacterized protein n=1 Tax=Ficus carica TaxID=3494 RepID=A0AA87YY40_FICCA|nr:hypothetical protein TIFTF001_040827 [Ficus carica]
MSFIIAGDNLLLCPDLEHIIGHSKRGKYNSAYSIDVYVVLAERKLTSYVYAVGKQLTGNL